MKILIIGSTAYKDQIIRLFLEIKAEGHEVRVPAYDDHPELDELGICEHNLELIKWADEVVIFWDQRSMGTVFDFGMAFALGKPVRVHYLEPKTLGGVMLKYQEKNGG